MDSLITPSISTDDITPPIELPTNIQIDNPVAVQDDLPGGFNDSLPANLNTGFLEINGVNYIPEGAPTIDDVQLDPSQPSGRQIEQSDLDIAQQQVFTNTAGTVPLPTSPIIITNSSGGVFSHLTNWLLIAGAAFTVYEFISGSSKRKDKISSKLEKGAHRKGLSKLRKAGTLEDGAPDTYHRLNVIQAKKAGINPPLQYHSRAPARSLMKRVKSNSKHLSFDPQGSTHQSKRLVSTRRKYARPSRSQHPFHELGDGYQEEHSRIPGIVPGGLKQLRKQAEAFDVENTKSRKITTIPTGSTGGARIAKSNYRKFKNIKMNK